MTIGAQLDADGDLAKQFEEFQERNSYETKSEAVRALIRESLERDRAQHQQQDADQQSDRPADAVAADGGMQLNLIEGNEPILLGIALLIGFDGILSALTSIAGALGAWLFIALSLLVSVWILLDVARTAGIWRSSSDDSATALSGN
jgi:Arc/MetJ-type ribon-helix-helix transcriptional regulator